MDLLEEIKQYFASSYQGAALLASLPQAYPAFVIRTEDGFGTAIQWEGDAPISEHFANAHLYSSKVLLDGSETNLLLFTMNHEELRNEFASVCAQFVDPGVDGEDREKLLANPLEWWRNWKNLMGNAIHDKAPYSVMCEMFVLNHILSLDPGAEWTASKSGTHDIESHDRSYEVKSTIKRYGASVTISSQFQLLTPKPLSLYFLRVEESPAGVSINDVKNQLINNGYNEVELERQLSDAGYEMGASARDKRYSILEKRVYNVDKAFPKITERSFKGDVIPNGVSQITYVVDLEVPNFENW